jgi:DNA repair exonuclease SbcCD nuclease subunit
MEAQRKKIDFILELSRKYKTDTHFCPILIAGDLGHRPQWGDDLLHWAFDVLGKNYDNRGTLIVIPGQHDLINHRLDKWNEKGFGLLHKKQTIEAVIPNRKCGFTLTKNTRLIPFPYSKKIESVDVKEKYCIALCHMMVIKSQKDKLWEAQDEFSAKWYLKKFPCYDLIVTGDNHQSFAVEYEGRILCNPGSLMRMNANQIDHRPSIYLWYAEDNSIERVYLPIEKDVISREHIEVVEQRNERIDAFVNRLIEVHPEMGHIGEDSLSFEGNMKEFLKTNRQRKRITEKIWEAIE